MMMTGQGVGISRGIANFGAVIGDGFEKRTNFESLS